MAIPIPTVTTDAWIPRGKAFCVADVADDDGLIDPAVIPDDAPIAAVVYCHPSDEHATRLAVERDPQRFRR